MGDLARRPALVGLGLLAVLFAGLGLAEAWDDAPTFDEPVNLASGLTALTRHDLRLNVEHPPLAKALAALPALLAHPDLPRGDAWEDAEDGAYSEAFVVANADSGGLRRVVFLSRLVPLACAIAVGFVLYALGTRLFGRLAGTVAGAVWLTLPPVLGFGHLNGLDVPFTLAVALTVLATDRFLERPERSRAAMVGLAVGGCLLVRTSGVVVLVAVVLGLLVAGRQRPRETILATLTVVAVAWVTLWGGYRALAPTGSDLPGDSPAGLSLLPAEYRAGIEDQEVFGEDSERSYVLGDYEVDGSWSYWPKSLALKLPITTLALAGLGAIAVWGHRRRPERLRIAFVVGTATALAAATVIGARPVGMRYLLPSVALGLVVASTAVGLLVQQRRRLAVLGAALGAQLAFLIGAAPHSLAWTSLPTDAPWQVAADSNLEWGQDFYALQAWSRHHHPAVAWSGPLPNSLLPNARPLMVDRPEKLVGWVAVNATTLTVYAHDQLSWLRAYCPVDDLGGTILIYRFVMPPTSAAGPEIPAGRCEGDVSVRTA